MFQDQYQDRKIAFFRNGILVDVYPRNNDISLIEERDNAYNSDSIFISDDEIYDPRKPETIMNLHIPKHIEGYMSSYNYPFIMKLDYYLKMACGSFENIEYIDYFIQLVLCIMKLSNTGWRRGDYLQVIRNYYRLGLYDKGDQFEITWRNCNKKIFSDPYDEPDESEHLLTKYYFENKIRRYKEFSDLSIIVPEILPKKVRGYLQIRTQRTKRFLEICRLAQERGYVFESREDHHYCLKINDNVQFEILYEKDASGGSNPKLKYIECPFHKNGECDGKNKHGLYCIFPINGSKTIHWKINFKHDPLLPEVISLVLESHMIREEYFQRKLGVDLNRAKKLINELEMLGIAASSEKHLGLDYTPKDEIYFLTMSHDEAVLKYGEYE